MSPDSSPEQSSDADAAGRGASDSTSQSTIAGVSRRTFIRGLVVATIGIPVAVESRTLIGLVDQHFLGGETHDGTAAASPDSVGVGDELLPGTAPTDRLASLVVEARDAGWTFVATVDVENTTDAPYELRVTGVETTSGSVDAGDTTGTLAPGTSTTLTSSTAIPRGSSPTAIEVVGITDPRGDAGRTVATVPLGNVPVKRTS